MEQRSRMSRGIRSIIHQISLETMRATTSAMKHGSRRRVECKRSKWVSLQMREVSQSRAGDGEIVSSILTLRGSRSSFLPEKKKELVKPRPQQNNRNRIV